MRKIIIATVLLFSVLNAKSQETEKVSVDKNMFGVQLGLVSANFQYEVRLARKIALRTETGLSGFLYKSSVYNNNGFKDESGFITAPFISVEPRWYYGLDRRARLKKNTLHNSSNYVGLRAGYFANNLELSNSNSAYSIVPNLTAIPYYGIRRTFAKNFNYEFAFGVGYQYNIFNSSKGCSCDHSQTIIDIQARIGYTF